MVSKFIILAIVGSVVLNLWYRLGRDKNEKEIGIFSSILGLNILGVILEFAFVTMNRTSLNIVLVSVLTRFYHLYLVLMALLFTVHLFTLCYRHGDEKTIKYYRKIKKLSYYVFYVLGVVMIFIPLKFYPDGTVSGSAVDLVYLYTAVCMFSWLITDVKNMRTLNQKKFVPYVLYILAFVAMIFVEKIHPDISLMASVQTIILFIMILVEKEKKVPRERAVAGIPEVIKEIELPKSNDVDVNCEEPVLGVWEEKQSSDEEFDYLSSLREMSEFSLGLLERDDATMLKRGVRHLALATMDLVQDATDYEVSKDMKVGKVVFNEREYEPRALFDEAVLATKARIGDELIRFKVTMDDEMPGVLVGDASRVKEVIWKLLIDACKYTKQGTIELKVDAIVRGLLCKLIVTVEDTGIGIREDDIPELFEDKRELAVTKRLVEEMNGRFVVQSEYGKGTRITVSLEQKLGNLASQERRDFAGKIVAIISDKRITLELVKKRLESYNIDVRVANDAEEARKVLANNECSLALVEANMKKEVSGFSNIPIALLGKSAEDGGEVLVKPVSDRELASILDKYL